MELYEVRQGIDVYKNKLDSLYINLNLEDKAERVKELEKLQLKEDFWDDPKQATQIINDLNQIKDIVEDHHQLVKQLKDIEETYKMIKESFDQDFFDLLENDYQTFLNDMETFELTALLSNPYDNSHAIVVIHPGAGGTESQDWASMLMRMYQRYADKKKFKVEILDYLDGEEAGLKSVTLAIRGINAYGLLKAEQGVHRLVRISPFDSSGRRHTSFASVDVMPEFDGDLQIELNTEDIKIDTYRASGAGGQHVNTTDSAVRMTHIPTGIVVTCQNERSQIKNREKALVMLKSKLLQKQLQDQEQMRQSLKGEQKDIGWGSQIRSYVFHPYSMVKDHRTNYETSQVQNVMDGEIDEFIYAYLKEVAQ